MMRYCKDCKSEIKPEWNTCPYCGTQILKEQILSQGIEIKIFASIFIIIGIISLYIASFWGSSLCYESETGMYPLIMWTN